jgi:hypothetical protein
MRGRGIDGGGEVLKRGGGAIYNKKERERERKGICVWRL